MKFIPITAECHSGYKADEYPVCFFWNNRRFPIKEIADHWYQANPDPGWPVADYFKVSTDDNHFYILKHELANDQWFLASSDETLI
ncbi:MAG TPA: hypothetical protein PKW80_14090 [Bacteroidales bacterium]|nr:hypothetical protein [Bacteroidales bacterium]